jgi:hypothetical protein
VLAERDRPARVLVHDDQLWVFTERPRSVDRTRSAVVGLTGLPTSAVRVVRVAALPRTSSGKPDYAALSRQAARTVADTSSTPAPVTPQAIRDLYAVLLGRPDATTHDSFVDLGGDSLSYVEASTRLGRALGTLPTGWQRLDPVALARTGRRRRRFTAPVDVSVALRAVALTLILVSHADLAQLQGGAHVLLAVAGYNLARFQLAHGDRHARVRSLLRSALAVAIPASLWIGAVTLVTGDYRWQTAVYLNGVTGTGRWNDDWQFWFLEALVWCYLGVAALVAIPWVDRWSRGRPFAVAAAVLVACCAARYALVGVEAGAVERYQAPVVMWCLALGWAAAAADTPVRRLVVAVAAAGSTIGFFGDTRRELIVVAGVVLLLADRAVPLPRIFVTIVQAVAAASLWVYLTQWQVYPGLEDAGHPYVAVLAALAAGICAHLAYERVSPTALVRWRSRTRRRTASSTSRALAPSARTAAG